MTKKLSAFFVTLIMLFSFSLISRGASADVTGNVVYGKKGDTVTVVIRLNSNPGFACLRLFAEYDSTALELKDACDEGLLGTGSVFKSVSTGKYSMSWGDKGERNIYYDQTGDIASLVFKITDKAKNEKYDIKLSYDRDFADDRDANPVTLNLTNGTIILSEAPTVSPTNPNAPATTAVPGTTQSNNPGTTKSGTQTTANSGSQNAATTAKSGTPTTAKSSGQNNSQSTVKNNGQGVTVNNTQADNRNNGQSTADPSSPAGQDGGQEFLVDQNGETIPKATHYPNTPVTDENGSTVYYPDYAELESMTDENGSIIYETALWEDSETEVQSKDSGDPSARSGSALKIIIIVAALAVAFVLIFFFVRRRSM